MAGTLRHDHLWVSDEMYELSCFATNHRCGRQPVQVLGNELVQKAAHEAVPQAFPRVAQLVLFRVAYLLRRP